MAKVFVTDGGADAAPNDPLTAGSFALVAARWLLACVALTLPIALVDALVDGERVWGAVHAFTAEGEGPQVVEEHWCELVRPSQFVRTRFNGYSALAYAYVAAALPFAWRWRDRLVPAANGLQAHWSYTAIVCATLVFGAACSFSYHASVVHEPYGRLDRASVAPLLLLPPLCFALALAPHRWSVHRVGWLGALLVLALAPVPHIVGYVGTGESTYNLALAGVALVVSVFVLGVYAAAVRPLGCTDWIGLGIALLLGGIALALRDPAAIGACRPEGAFVYATHGFWHIFSACAVGAVWAWAWSG